MKKLLTTLLLTGFICTAFAQQVFKTIHFNAINVAHKDITSNRPLNGTINISMKDSVIVVNDGNNKNLKSCI